MSTSTTVYSNDLYERLGVPRSASADEIKRAYQRNLRAYPPERAPEEFKRIREAYETLGNAESRREYDESPDPQAVESFDRAMQAMRSSDYANAERLFKQVLLLDPDSGFVRNMLGLCFLYSGELKKAAEQFDRLLGRPDAAPAWFGNAAVAALRLEDYARSERLFNEAIRRSDGDNAMYYGGLADVYIAREEYAKARQLLEKAIAADGKVDFEDLAFFTKLLELGIIRRDHDAVVRELSRIEKISADEEQRRYLAWKLGVLTVQLVELAAFSFAKPIAALSRHLQPDDGDYEALWEVSHHLIDNQFDAATAVVRSHPSFHTGGWLVALGPKIQAYCVQNRVNVGLDTKASPPTMWTLNGVGTMLYGDDEHDAATQSHVSVLWFTVFFVPVIPLARYRVIPAGEKSWRFLGQLPLGRELERWRAIVLALIFICVIWGIASSSSPSATSSQASRGGYSVPTSVTAPSTNGAISSSVDDPTSGNAAAGGMAPNAASTQDPGSSWYETERSGIKVLVGQISALDQEIESAQGEIERLKRQLENAEAGVGAYEAGDDLYTAQLNRHNRLVRAYNAQIVERNALYATYKNRLEHFNSQVEFHNSRR